MFAIYLEELKTILLIKFEGDENSKLHLFKLNCNQNLKFFQKAFNIN